MSSVSLPEEVRAACAWVTERARFVGVDEAAIGRYASALRAGAAGDEGAAPPAWGDREAGAAFAICMNAINFGSGWWPTVRKRPGHSGYATMAAGVEERFAAGGAWSADELQGMDVVTIAAVVGQEAEHPLMGQFAAALRDVGMHLRAEHGGRYLDVVERAGSIPDLARAFSRWDSFADVSLYEERRVPFFKRAQLAAADLHRAGVAQLPGIGELTAFADNLVPHVLRMDGVLRLDPALAASIDGGALLVHGSPEEVELRACAVQAIELLARAGDGELSPAEIDSALWLRGRGQRYKAIPRPRSRNTAY
jgi:hypothetical protein